MVDQPTNPQNTAPVSSMTTKPTVTGASTPNAAAPTPIPVPQDPTRVAKPTPQEIAVVAKAMDVDYKLRWGSKNHEDITAIVTAKAQARIAILGYRAVEGLAGFISADNDAKAKVLAANQKKVADAKAAADARAAKVAAANPPAASPPPSGGPVQPKDPIVSPVMTPSPSA